MNRHTMCLLVACLALTACPQDQACENACQDEYGFDGPQAVEQCECDAFGRPYIPYQVGRANTGKGRSLGTPSLLTSATTPVEGTVTITGAAIGDTLRLRRATSWSTCYGSPRKAVVSMRTNRRQQPFAAVRASGRLQAQPVTNTTNAFVGTSTLNLPAPFGSSLFSCNTETTVRKSVRNSARGTVTVRCLGMPLCTSHYAGRSKQ